MRTWEMIKMLTENPKLKAKYKDDPRECYVEWKNGILTWQGKSQQGQEMWVSADREWEIIEGE